MPVFMVVNTVIAITALIFGAFTLRHEPRNVAYQSFFIFTAGVALSASAKLFFQEDKNFLVFLFVWWGFDLMILGIFSLAGVSPDGKLQSWSVLPIVSWFILFISIPILLVAASFWTNPDAFFWRQYHDIFPILAIFVALYLIISFLSCAHYRESRFGLPFHIVRSLIFVVSFSASVICVSDLILPDFGIYRFSTVSNFVALAVLVIGGYGIAYYDVGNGGLVLRRGIPYFLSLVMVAIIFFSIEFSIEKFFYQNDEVVDIAASVVGAIAFCPLRDFFNKVTDKIFFRNSCRFLDATKEFGERLNTSFDRETLLSAIAGFLHASIRPTETVFFAVTENSKETTFVSGLAKPAIAAADYGALAALFLDRAPRDIVVSDVVRLFHINHGVSDEKGAHEEIKKCAARLGVAAIVPISARGDIKMIMMVGHKCSGALLGKDDVELLGIVARRAAIAIENFELRELMDQQTEKFEERVTDRIKRLKNMYESQSKILADVSHEFKTPLAILKMHASVFAASRDAEQKKAWYVMDTTLDRLSRLVGNILDVARTSSLRDGQCHQYVAVKDLLFDARDDCALLAEDKGIHLHVSSESMSVSGERDKLMEVVLNLLSNALRHTPAGGSIVLSACMVEGEAEITVCDTGSGISRENLPHIFERFYRIGESDFTGTGIGLYLCRQIVEGYRGTIAVESQRGKGSCFTVRLPLSTGYP
jgi:signal transduction histidine kinase/MFS family permease